MYVSDEFQVFVVAENINGGVTVWQDFTNDSAIAREWLCAVCKFIVASGLFTRVYAEAVDLSVSRMVDRDEMLQLLEEQGDLV